MTTMNVGVSHLIVSVVGTGDVTDDDGTPMGRGLLLSVGGNLNPGRNHKFFVEASEDEIRAFGELIGRAFRGHLSFETQQEIRHRGGEGGEPT